MGIINDQVTQPFAMSQNGRIKMQHFLTKSIFLYGGGLAHLAGVRC